MSDAYTDAVGSDECLAFTGQRGKGKTHAALHVLCSKERASNNRWLYIDPVGTARVEDAVIVSNGAGMVRALRQTNFRIIYQYDETTSDLSYWQVVEVFRRWAQAANVKCTLALDEFGAMLEECKGRKPPQDIVSMCRRGRHYGAAVVFVTQRMFDIPPNMRNNLHAIHVFGLGVGYDISDFNRLDTTGSEKRMGDVIRDLAPYHCVRYTPDSGAYTVLKPVSKR